MNKNRLFTTPIWHEHKIEFLKSLDKASNKYIKDTRKKEIISLIYVNNNPSGERWGFRYKNSKI